MKKYICICIAIIFSMSVNAVSQIPRTLSYQGVLTDSSGTQRDGTINFTFRLYESLNGGTPIWIESKLLLVNKGFFSTSLGDVTPFGGTVMFDKPYWLSIQVGHEPELEPRISLNSVGYSLRSLQIDTVGVGINTQTDSTGYANIFQYHGNVGIGTTKPGNRLEINVSNNQPAADGITIFNTDESGYGGSINFGISPPDPGPFLAAQITALHYDSTQTDGGNLIFKTGLYDNNHKLEERVRIDAKGRVGIGTESPTVQLEINGDTKSQNMEVVGSTKMKILKVTDKVGIGTSNPTVPLEVMGRTKMQVVEITNKVGVGTSNPSASLDVNGSTKLKQLEVRGNVGIGTSSPSALLDVNGSTKLRQLEVRGNVGIGTSNPTVPLEVVGRTKTNVLEIVGGSDIAEPFEMSDAKPLPEGALVIIDRENPGKLTLSQKVYDKCIAGVISGAGGVKPGLILTQEGIFENGQHVALSGKVYALATTSNGTIEPGDLLTTSNIPGHAMKATDQMHWPGAVIGKAMSGLNDGEGLVLVLVNLQ